MANRRLLYSCFGILISCLLSVTAIAQTQVLDSNRTFGRGTTIRITTSTNPETFIRETKYEYFDESGTLRREVIRTKDLDGNSVKIEKYYDKRGTLRRRYETRQDPNENLVYNEGLEYDDKGKRINGIRQGKTKDGKIMDFPFDEEKQEFGEGRVIGALTVAPQNPDQMYCDCPRMFLNTSYSVLISKNQGSSDAMPLGAEVGLGYRVNDRFSLILDVSGHCRSENDQRWSRWNILTGVQYAFTDCGEEEIISPFSRLMLGLTREQFKYNSTKSSGGAFAAALGAGADVKLGPRCSARINADWMPSFFNKDLQNNFRIGAGLVFNLGDCQKLVN